MPPRLILLWLAAWPLGAVGGVPPSGEGGVADSVRLAPVTVVARFVPADAALRADSALLAAFRLRPLGEALGAATALNLKTYGPGALTTAGYRGGAARHTLVRWNGLRLNSPLHGTVDLSALATDGLEGVRLDAGSSAASRAGGAPGGLLDLATGAPTADRGLALGLGAGAFGERSARLRAGYGGGGWTGRSLAGGALARNDFPLRHPAAGDLGRMPDAALQRLWFQQDLEARGRAGGRWHGALALHHADRALAPALFTTDQGERQRDRLGLASLRWDARPAGEGRAWTGYLRAGWVGEQVRYANAAADLLSVGEAHSAEAGGGLAWAPRPDWRADASVFLRREAVQSTGLARPEVRWEERLRGSLTWLPGPRWALRADLLQDRYGGAFQPVLPALHARWGRGGWSLRAGMARHYTRPALNDLLWQPGGNPDLMAERGWSADLESRWTGALGAGRLDLQAQGWSHRIRHWIQWVPAQDGLWSARNLSGVAGQGTELRAGWSGGGWRFGGLWAWTRIRPLAGEVLLYQPEHRAVASLGWSGRHRAWSWALDLRAQAIGARYASTDGSDRLPANAALGADAALTRTAPAWRWTVGLHLENATDAWIEAVRNRPLPGRHARLDLAIAFGGRRAAGQTPSR